MSKTQAYNLNRTITGIIQEDRIWEQWYDPSVFKKEMPQMNQKDYLFSCIGDDENRVIINNRSMTEITVGQFKKMIFTYEKAFAAMKLHKGDVIATIGLTTPEMYAIKYSATSLGLILCNLNVLDAGVIDENKNRLFRQLENIKPKIIFILDVLEDKVYQIINAPEFENAVKVSMPLEYSTPKWNPEKWIIALKVSSARLFGKKIKGQLSLESFLAKGKTVADEDVVEIYEKGLPCNISFTSGTTGINKAVLISHDANNAVAFQHKLGNFGFQKGTRNLALIPPFLAFWDAIIVHTVLCLGGENIIELNLDWDIIPKYFKKHSPNMGVWSQYLWSSILTIPKKDLYKVCNNLKYAIIGGERCDINAAETFYKKTGIMPMTGFGASEVNTTFSLTHPNCSKIGSSGIPLPFNNVKIVDDSFNDVTYNKPGKLFITGPCLMNGYYNREDLTRKAIYIDSDGVSWYNTGDYAVMDEDGCLTVLDRYAPPVDLANGETVQILDIVEIIKRNRNIKNCKITYHSGRLVLHLSLDNFIGLSKENAINSIIDMIKSDVAEKFWPDIINVVHELPRTPVGKVDYKSLERLGAELSQICMYSNKLVVTMNDYQSK